VEALTSDPLGQGVSLEELRKEHDVALAQLKVPRARQALWYVAALLDLPQDAPAEEVRRRIAIIDVKLAKLPGTREYFRRYTRAQERYSFALARVTNELLLRGDALARQPAGAAHELRRRGDALIDVAGELDDMQQWLWDTGAVVWTPTLAMAMDLKTLSSGFGGLGQQFRDFAAVMEGRQGEYDREVARIAAEGDRLEALVGRAL
jgi:hypothetical protein